MMLSTEQLISLVKKHPVLYDPEHGDYKDSIVRNGAWEKIAVETTEDINELKCRWKNLKDSFTKYIKANLEDATRKSYYKNWKWAAQMEQFRKYLPYYTRYNHSSSENIDDETTELQMVVIQTDSGESSPNFETKAEVCGSPEFVDASFSPEHQQQEQEPFEEDNCRARSTKRPASPINGASDYMYKKQRFDLSPIETIFLGYAQTIQKFSPKRQAMTKLKIAQIIMEQELLAIEEADTDIVKSGNS